MIGMQRIFKIIDDNRSGTLSIQEFWKALCDFRIKISQEECRALFDMFDEDESDEISIDEFIQNLKGPMSPFRKELVKKAYQKLDATGDGLVDFEDFNQVFNAKRHPEVVAQKKTE